MSQSGTDEQNAQDEREEEYEEQEELQFGYGASAVFLIFLVGVIYVSLSR